MPAAWPLFLLQRAPCLRRQKELTSQAGNSPDPGGWGPPALHGVAGTEWACPTPNGIEGSQALGETSERQRTAREGCEVHLGSPVAARCRLQALGVTLPH